MSHNEDGFVHGRQRLQRSYLCWSNHHNYCAIWRRSSLWMFDIQAHLVSLSESGGGFWANLSPMDVLGGEVHESFERLGASADTTWGEHGCCIAAQRGLFSRWVDLLIGQVCTYHMGGGMHLSLGRRPWTKGNMVWGVGCNIQETIQHIVYTIIHKYKCTIYPILFLEGEVWGSVLSIFSLGFAAMVMYWLGMVLKAWCQGHVDTCSCVACGSDAERGIEPRARTRAFFRVWVEDSLELNLREDVPWAFQLMFSTSMTHHYWPQHILMCESGQHFRTWKTSHTKKTTSNLEIFLMSLIPHYYLQLRAQKA